ncbi:FAD/NAD(P)-binding protein [Marinactinospora thermotolerans]|uniref:Uncharacterized NAD(P)/FAD-binding protein YdhS n=1 Tax=Marinactinospora thermotolerans DSM 45154 TaxID=1122192 RepID=A0A1T4TDW0_9ACTN|nr:FAD/NAD(P)-binding protein [Marinactinospora thermotolerans]SKA38389.1 Uncharacterized NAD(P)/FAD-binding protein YdhS [Marinactinospora thermotolerans DSM 45154]
MVREPRNPERRPVIAFVGGGASATLTAIALLRTTTWLRLGYRIVLLDEHGRHARGVAYSTRDDQHLLNSPAAAMSALPDQPGHLVAWARAAGHACAHDSFLPRRVYGDYLAQTLAETAAWAAPHAEVHLRTARVERAEDGDQGVVLILSDGTRLPVAAAVVATGNAPASPPPGCAGTAGVVDDPWHPHGDPARLTEGRTVLAIGTGLSTVDVALSVTAAHPGTVVHATSARGRLPHPHRLPLIAPPGLVDLSGPLPLRELVRRVRAAIDVHPGDWRHVVDSLRPSVPLLWQGLSPAEQRVFLRRFSRYWEPARHRMAPEVARRLEELRARGRLRLHTGRVASVEPTGAGLRAVLSDGTSIQADTIVNCTGSAPGSDPFVQALLGDGLARRNHLGLGVDTCPRGALVAPSGRVSRHLFALGPLRRGQLYETTAVPEIRAQAERLAQRIADTVLRGRRGEPTVVP